MSDRITTLQKQASDCMEHAYSPYSNFSVGAALVTEKGTVYSGCNVENVSFGLSICAERNAIGQAIANEGNALKIQEIFITNRNKDGLSVPCSPCGACRQVIAEFANADTKIHYQGESGDISVTMDQLLPDSFRF